MKFNSQICTTREQSERLLSLGLKKETADMVHYFSSCLTQDWTIVPLAENETARNIQGLEIPAWSLHRLIEMVAADDIPEYMLFLPDVYDEVIAEIEVCIKNGWFNKGYLDGIPSKR